MIKYIFIQYKVNFLYYRLKAIKMSKFKLLIITPNYLKDRKLF